MKMCIRDSAQALRHHDRRAGARRAHVVQVGVHADEREQHDGEEAQKARHDEAAQHLLLFADEAAVGEHGVMEAVAQALQARSDDEVHAALELSLIHI